MTAVYYFQSIPSQTYFSLYIILIRRRKKDLGDFLKCIDRFTKQQPCIVFNIFFDFITSAMKSAGYTRVLSVRNHCTICLTAAPVATCGNYRTMAQKTKNPSISFQDSSSSLTIFKEEIRLYL